MIRFFAKSDYAHGDGAAWHAAGVRKARAAAEGGLTREIITKKWYNKSYIVSHTTEHVAAPPVVELPEAVLNQRCRRLQRRRLLTCVALRCY